MEHQSAVMNRGTATLTSFRENILIFSMHPHPPTEIPQPWIQFRRPPPPLLATFLTYWWCSPLPWLHSMTFPGRSSSCQCVARKISFQLSDPLVVSAVGNVFSGLTDEGNVPTGLDSGWKKTWGDGWSCHHPRLINWHGPLIAHTKFQWLNSYRNAWARPYMLQANLVNRVRKEVYSN